MAALLNKNYDGNNQQLSVTALNFTLRTIIFSSIAINFSVMTLRFYRLLETIFIKETWTRSKVSDYLLHNMPEDVTEQLLNLAVEEEVQVESHEEQPGDLFFEDKSADIKIAAEEEFSDTSSQKSAKDTDAEENEKDSEISDDISAKISSDESDNEYVGSILRKTNDAQEFEGNSDQLKSSPSINGNKGNNEECILKDDEQRKHNKTVEAKEVKDQIGTTTKNGKQPTADTSRDDESNLKKLKSGSRKRKIQPNIMLKDNMHQEESMQGQKRITRSYSLRNKRH
ncbi:uncharacterized protein TRIADDRAFT_61333 [Trichoplax adhaerens]|uniref:Uncharacterized protein n=1 Tax=Trichoplax adhaerens TaxID=10228 RepID=B3SAP6_TRIAD|nr:predicted protein [Trichoplax adhaerens]EDV20138.1 predicted protein [Trichoplax adhaerens]|eukprot:XP_002117299.1 predicted protein [Trichoplax adhaerens]